MSVSAAASTRVKPARISVRAALALIVLAASALHIVLALRVPSPWVFPDELRYSELAKSLGDGGLPKIRGRVTFDFGLGYPLLLAPIWALFQDVSLAYTAAKVVNSLALSLTAVPVFFLARRFVDERSALVAAALSVTIPSLLYAGTLMTEVALYPTFALALLAVAVALERPLPSTQAAALGAIALASVVKVLALTLLAGYLLAIVMFHWLDTRQQTEWRARVRRYWPTGLVLALGGLLVVARSLAAGRGLTSQLGAYDFVLGAADLSALPSWMFFHVAAFDLFIAIIPFAASMLVVANGLKKDSRRDTRLWAVLTLTTCVPVFLAVAVYSSNAVESGLGYATGAGANERATFVLAPLALIGLTVWLRDRPGGNRGLVAAGVVAAFMPVAIPLDRFERNEVSIQAFSLVPWVGERGGGSWSTALAAYTLVMGALFVAFALIRAREVAFVAPVAAAFLLVTFIAQSVIEISAEGSKVGGLAQTANWIDRANRGQHVSVLWYEPPGGAPSPSDGRLRIVWLNEFYNRTVDSVFEIGDRLPFSNELVSTAVRLDNGRVVLADGRPASLGPLVLAPCYVRIAGRSIAEDTLTGATVYRVDGAVRATVSPPRECRG